MAIGFAYGPPDLTVGNPSLGSFLYLKGDEFTDGSIRAVVDDAAENWQLENREDGAWNTTGLMIAASSVHLGRELLLSGAGEFASTLGFSTGTEALLPHVEFDADGTSWPHSPVLFKKIVRVIVQPDDSVEFTGDFYQTTQPSILRGLRTAFYIRTGSTVPTEPVTFQVRLNAADGFLLYETAFPASLFVADSEVILAFEGAGFQLNVGDTVFNTWTSPTPFSIKTNATGNNWLALDVLPLEIVDLMIEAFTLSNDGGITISNDGRFASPIPETYRTEP